MRLAVASVSVCLIASLTSAANSGLEQTADELALKPIVSSSLSEAETTERCRSFFVAVGVLDAVYQGPTLGYSQGELAGFAFARLGTRVSMWAGSTQVENDLAQAYAAAFGPLHVPSDHWDKPLFISDKATCLAVYEASQ